MHELSWLLVATKPRSEFVARQHLERQGFQVCLPQITLRKRQRGAWQQLTEPMFPGYLFVGVVLGGQDIAPIRSTQGCRELVRFGGQLIPIPDDAMRKFLVADTSPLEHKSIFSAGQSVRVEASPFAGLEAVFERVKGIDRVQILLCVLGGLRPVLVDHSSISPL